jgi:hypothetical protein
LSRRNPGPVTHGRFGSYHETSGHYRVFLLIIRQQCISFFVPDSLFQIAKPSSSKAGNWEKNASEEKG